VKPVTHHNSQAKKPLLSWEQIHERQRSEKKRKLDQFLHYVNQQKGWEGTDLKKNQVTHKNGL